MKLPADLHIHSCLSPCGAEDMTPYNLVNMAALCGCRAVALSDHNTTRNCAAAMAAGEKAGVLVVPAMELCTAEEVHTLVYLPDLEAAEALRQTVYAALPKRKNRPEVFGRQILMGENDEPVGEEEALLSAATSIGIYKVAAIAESLGGIAVPAHIDRASFSLLSNLGFAEAAMGFSVFEITKGCNPETLKKRIPLPAFGCVRGSDAHDLFAIAEPPLSLEVETPTPRGVIEALKKLGQGGP